MSPDPSFQGLMCRVRAGDERAAAELLDRYGPEIRRYIRLRMTTPSLNRFLESGDIFQSVLANFFVRVMAGQFDLDDPTQLVRLLMTMAHHKIVDYARKPAQRRSVDRTEDAWQAMPGPDETPSQVLARVELMDQVRARLTDAERQLVELRDDGRSWQEVASACGLSAEGARKQLARALDRVCQELGLDGDGHA
jgi:RNA polymerase sigma-70 factor (ECF subfamily)